MPNLLVAESRDPAATAGLGMANGIANLTADHEPWEFAIDGVSTGLDTISLALDPFGMIAAYGVGWLLQHVEFLREPLDKLTGDAAAVTAMTSTWENIAERLHQSAQTYVDSLRTVESWAGLAAEHYRAAAEDLVNLMAATGNHASHAAQGMTAAGILVATERAIIFDALSKFLGRLIVEALVALASSWFTFGASLAAFVTAVDIDAAIQAETLALRLGALMRQLSKFAQKFDGMGGRAKALADDVHRAGGTIRMKAGGQKGLKTIAKNRYVNDHSPAVQHLLEASAALRNGPLNTVHSVADNPLVRQARTGVVQAERQDKAADEQRP